MQNAADIEIRLSSLNCKFERTLFPMSYQKDRCRMSGITHLVCVVVAVEPPAGGAANEERDADDEHDGDGDEAADLLRRGDHRRHFRESSRNSGRQWKTDCLLLRRPAGPTPSAVGGQSVETRERYTAAFGRTESRSTAAVILRMRTEKEGSVPFLLRVSTKKL